MTDGGEDTTGDRRTAVDCCGGISTVTSLPHSGLKRIRGGCSIGQMDRDFMRMRDCGGREFDPQELFGSVEKVAGFGGCQCGVVGKLLESGAVGGSTGDTVGAVDLDVPGALLRLSGVGADGASNIDRDVATRRRRVEPGDRELVLAIAVGRAVVVVKIIVGNGTAIDTQAAL